MQLDELDELYSKLELEELEEADDPLLWLDQDELDMLLDELDELDDRSSIDKICNLSWLLGPGNCKLPVWKLRTSGALASPVAFVSTNCACQI